MNIAAKLPFELWEYNLNTNQAKKHSAFEKRIDAEKMKRALEARKSSVSLFTITVNYLN
jgi:hypothetical protein